MKDIEIYKDGFCLSTKKDRLDLKAIHTFLSQEAYWSKNIPYKIVEKAANNSLTFGIYHNGSQVAYARIISDFATFAYLCDVFVLPQWRKRGLSKWLMQTIMTHPELQGLRRWNLLTGDAHGLYKQFGWVEPAFPERWMEINDRNVYQVKQLEDEIQQQ